MKVYLTEQSAKVSLSEAEVQSLVEGKEVIGAPDTEFLSPFGKRIVIVVKEEATEDMIVIQELSNGKKVYVSGQEITKDEAHEIIISLTETWGTDFEKQELRDRAIVCGK
ncbi:hypothetical protein ES703_78847 [subsurface metagenome]